ncbi:MAG: extracellular solute-binding protein [Hyphomicrobiales bacterium]|nr:extracellular solute-binding protein [Hyphomicrobiales bacterium]
MRVATLTSALAGCGLACLAVQSAAAEQTVNIYSYREPQLIEPLLAQFKTETGITARVVYAPSGLIERMVAEGRNSPADVLLTAESGLLFQAKDAGVTRAVSSEALSAAIPAALRDPDGHWFALTRRARVVYASKDRVAQNMITYEELADPKWKVKICSRSGQHPYNVTLVASMIAALGPEKAETWLKGVKANLARKPAGGDREQVRDVHAGLCDLAIGNTYYMGLMQTNTKAPEQQQWAAAVKVLFPNAADRGTHVNVSGAAIAANAPNPAAAVRLVEFLASGTAQRLYAEVNNEYPVLDTVQPSERVASWGTLKADPRPLAEVVRHRKTASDLIDKVGFDAGP